MDMKMMADKIKGVLAEDGRVIFAYLFGSSLRAEDFNDIDIATYCIEHVMENPFDFTSSLKIALSKTTGIPPDSFDITLINALLRSDRIDSLMVLGEIFDGMLLIDHNPFLRIDIIEKTSAQFRESEGILQEIFAR